MKKEDYRPIEYNRSSRSSTQAPKIGLFHTLVKKKEDNGEDFYLVLIETENGELKEVHYDTIKFID